MVVKPHPVAMIQSPSGLKRSLTLAEMVVGKERMDGWGSLNTRKAGKRVGLTA